MNEHQEAIKVLNLDHLGIVAGIIDEMELVEEVKKIVGITTQEKLSPGQVMKAMILNGLGFLSAPLYIFEEFFAVQATEHLIGKGILPEHLNDDRLGRVLDKYYQTGTTKIFTAIAIKAAHKFQVKMNSIHLDGSSMYVQGEYKNEVKNTNQTEKEAEPETSEMKPIEIVHGYSIDHRPDLKQFIIDMIVTGDGDIPLYLKIDSGNIDDKSVFVERLKEFKKQWTFEGICVADSALYTKDNLSAMTGIKWITRVPLSIKSAQYQISDIKESEWKASSKKGYKIAERSSEYGNIQQRWLVIESELRKKASIKQIDKQVNKQQ
ncbi:IS1634 family transposase [Microcoleus sp. N3A4]